MQIDFIDEILKDGVSHLGIVEICMKEPVKIRLDGVLVLKKRLPDRLSLYSVIQGVLALLKLRQRFWVASLNIPASIALTKLANPFSTSLRCCSRLARYSVVPLVVLGGVHGN